MPQLLLMFIYNYRYECLNICTTEKLSSNYKHGYTRLTHSYLTAREAPPVCTHRRVRLSVSHILTKCPRYHVARYRFFPSLSSLRPSDRLSDLPYSPTPIIQFHSFPYCLFIHPSFHSQIKTLKNHGEHKHPCLNPHFTLKYSPTPFSPLRDFLNSSYILLKPLTEYSSFLYS